MALSTKESQGSKDLDRNLTPKESQYQKKMLTDLLAAGIGKPRKYKRPEDMLPFIVEYFENTKRPTVIGITNALAMSKSTFSKYRNDPNMKDYSNLLELAVAYAEESTIDGGLSGRLNGSFTQFYTKNAHGYTDKRDVDVNHSGVVGIKEVLQSANTIDRANAIDATIIEPDL